MNAQRPENPGEPDRLLLAKSAPRDIMNVIVFVSAPPTLTRLLMPFCRTLLVLVVSMSTVAAGELRTLKGDAIKGELVSISDKEIVFDKGGDKITTSLRQVLGIDLATPTRLPVDAKYILVELVDGSVLRCLNFGIKGKTVELTLLLTGQKVKLPLAAISNVLTNAQEEKYQKDWRERLHDFVVKKKRRDILALLNQDVVNGLPGIIGEADEEGKNLTFTTDTGKKRSIPMARVHGLIFQRTPDPLAPLVLGKLHDSYQNILMVSSFTTTPTGLTVTTSAGAKLDYTLQQLAKLDCSTGKLAFLSDMKPSKEVRSSNAEAHIVLMGKDRNLDGDGPIVMNRLTYAKGLALQAYTELEFDLDGDYLKFSAMAGIDDKIKRPDADLTILRIECDGVEVVKMEFSRKKEPLVQPINLNVKDVQKLRITVSSGDVTDVGKHVSLGDAKVSK
jgi:NPCBM/NEW2 domain